MARLILSLCFVVTVVMLVSYFQTRRPARERMAGAAALAIKHGHAGRLCPSMVR